MTLLESLVALVVFGLAATGLLASLQATARSVEDADAWVRAVAEAEAAMEASKLGAGPPPLPGGPRSEARVTVTPWPGAPGMRVVTVTVPLPRGGALSVQRLVPAPS